MAPTGRIPPRARLAAAFVALAGLAGLTLQTIASTETAGSVPAALWAMLRFFTIIGNLVCMTLFGAIALGITRTFEPRRLAGIALVMALIGTVYVTLLRNVEHLVGAARYANMFTHYAVPVLAALYWLACAPKGHLRPRDSLRWAALPLAYFPYAIARAMLDGRYAYPFIDAGALGWPRVILNALGIAAGFFCAGMALVWLDRAMAGRATAPAP